MQQPGAKILVRRILPVILVLAVIGVVVALLYISNLNQSSEVSEDLASVVKEEIDFTEQQFVAGSTPSCFNFVQDFSDGRVPNYIYPVTPTVLPSVVNGELQVYSASGTVSPIVPMDLVSRDYVLEGEISKVVPNAAAMKSTTDKAWTGIGITNYPNYYLTMFYGTNKDGTSKSLIFELYNKGTKTHYRNLAISANTTKVKFKLERSSYIYTAYYSLNDGPYQLLGSMEMESAIEAYGFRPRFVTGSYSLGMNIDNFKLSCAPAPASDSNVKSPVYRFWSDQKQKHFYTISADERDYVVANYNNSTWKYEGIAYYAYPANADTCTGGRQPVYRFWSDQNQGHFYTISTSEKAYVQTNYPTRVWKYEKVAYCAVPNTVVVAGSVPLHRFWSDKAQSHFYTANTDEKNYIVNNYSKAVWNYETTAYYVFPN